MEKRSRSFVLYLLVALAAGLLVRRAFRPQAARLAPDGGQSSQRASAQPPRAAPGSRARARPAAAPDPRRCEPYTAEHCYRGDLWAMDSCGHPLEKIEECDNSLCQQDACDEPDLEPCAYPPDGRCDGDIVRLCQAGHAISIDCGLQGLRCGYGDEGAQCLPPIPAAEHCHAERARCEGEVLLHCDAERKVRTDCRELGARCLQLPGSPAPSCVQVRPFLPSGSGCGPCGCPPAAGASERDCDGRDDDGDQLLDEGLDCGPVPVIAFIITDAGGQASHDEADVEAELARANRLFAREPPEDGLHFTLQELIFLPDSDLLDVDDADVARMADDPRLHPERSAFYVPLVFTDRILAAGKVPKLGISTLPNGTCGGMQLGQGPEVGFVGVAKTRAPTTVAHELGHFLGLCHTHEDEPAVPLLASSDPQHGTLTACRSGCRSEGDGVCDTPYDPGPPRCSYDVGCHAWCEGPAAPDASNLMSYYTECRSHFSAEQLALMQHTLALRRGWQRCLAGRCMCQLGADDCPVGMTCQPFALADGARTARCALDGMRGPGAECSHGSDCGRGAICLADPRRGVQRCVRPCSASAEHCECTAAGDELNVCIEDLGT